VKFGETIAAEHKLKEVAQEMAEMRAVNEALYCGGPRDEDLVTYHESVSRRGHRAEASGQGAMTLRRWFRTGAVHLTDRYEINV